MPKLDPTTIPIPDWTTIGELRKQKGSGGRWQQRWRFLDDPPRKVRTTSSGTTNKRTAAKVITQRINAAIRKELTKNDPQVKKAITKLETHIDEYENSLLADGNSSKHVNLTINRIKRIIEDHAWEHTDDIDKLKVKSWLAQQRKKDMSAQSAVHFATCIKAFTRWMALHDKTDKDMLFGMKAKPNGDIPTTFTRRAFTRKEFDRLIKNARESSESFRDLKGEDRIMIYEVARQTGLRARELSTITSDGCHLDGDAPYIQIDCTISKRRKHDRLQIPKALARKLHRYIESRDQDSSEPLWGSSWWRQAMKMLRLDMNDIAESNKHGVLHFHSLRHARVTAVVEAGASMMDTMQICRLSSPTLVDKILPPQRRETHQAHRKHRMIHASDGARSRPDHPR